MKIETITYKRVKNLGNFENETFQATATLEEGEDEAVTAKRLMSFVIGQLYPVHPTSEQGQEVENF